MPASYKQQVVDLLKALETRDPKPFSYINPNKYIQHNLSVGPGPAGVAALAKSLPPDTKVNTIRVFEDGDFVFAHTEYDFFGPKIGFDVFRFESGLIVEHWDNLQVTASQPGPSGHSMVDGPTTASDIHRTEVNKALMRRYMARCPVGADGVRKALRRTPGPTLSQKLASAVCRRASTTSFASKMARLPSTGTRSRPSRPALIGRTRTVNSKHSPESRALGAKSNQSPLARGFGQPASGSTIGIRNLLTVPFQTAVADRAITQR